MTLLSVALDVPLHRLFDYRWSGEGLPAVGSRVLVPFARSERVGVVVGHPAESSLPAGQIREASSLLADTPPLPADFFRLAQFASAYYQAPLGEVILQALPAAMKRVKPAQRRAGRWPAAAPAQPLPELTDEQARAIAAVDFERGYSASLLFGITGSGKTEVYLRLIARALERQAQVLLLVPEINLTPQLEARVRGRFPAVKVATLHSELTEAARERHWRAAFSGEAGIVLGTRLAAFTPMPALGLVVVDEEHDPSFKQQDGMRYSARDLAVFRARDRGIPIVLGSATPALETWANAEHGRYQRLLLTERANRAARLPLIRLIDSRKIPAQEGISAPVVAAVQASLERGEQSLVFLNRRGYAPVLACAACGWVSRCRRCAANLVVHLADRRLRCHHCGDEGGLPRACPCCGNLDIQPFGRGTQRLEAWLQEAFPTARVLRVDRDAVKTRQQWLSVLERIHAGEADILVGTQMLAKGHDFPLLTCVAVLGADAALHAADWRAPERLFAQLMQVAGRAGRAERPGEVLIQTQNPDHPLYAALVAHDYPAWARSLLAERETAGFPPYSAQAMLRAEAPAMEDALAFLQAAVAAAPLADSAGVALYDAVPMRLARLANLDRAQLLAESPSRRALQAFLPLWRQAIEELKVPARLRWHLEVDPQSF